MNRFLAIFLISAVAVALTACDKYGNNYVILDGKTMKVESHLKNETPPNRISNAETFRYSLMKNCGTERFQNELRKADKENADSLILENCEGITFVIKNVQNLGR